MTTGWGLSACRLMAAGSSPNLHPDPWRVILFKGSNALAARYGMSGDYHAIG
jgi:hypothetical protein